MQRPERVRESDGAQCRAARQSTVRKLRSRGEDEVFKAAFRDAVYRAEGQGGTCDVGRAVESGACDVCRAVLLDAVRDGHRRKRSAAGECVFPYALHALRDGDGDDVGVVLESSVRDLCDGFAEVCRGNDHRLHVAGNTRDRDATVGESFIGQRACRERGRQIHAGKGAVRELYHKEGAVHADLGDAESGLALFSLLTLFTLLSFVALRALRTRDHAEVLRPAV